MRGLSPAYTKVLINGEEVPGAGADRSFFVDRIPAELIERVEIIRSPSANRSADAIAGTLNIVLRDGYSLDGGYLRAGGLRYDDGEFKESLGGVYGTELGGGRLLLGANLQGRYNPRKRPVFATVIARKTTPTTVNKLSIIANVKTIPVMAMTPH